MTQARQYIVTAASCLLLAACGKEESPAYVNVNKETFPVTGQVRIDGEPGSKVLVTCHNIQEAGNVQGTLGLTDENGKLEFSTYQSGDGVPEGEYVMTFEWGDWDDYWKRLSGPDKLNGRYSDPKKSEIRFTVKKGEPTDLGIIELTTK